MMGYPLNAKWMSCFGIPVSIFRRRRWDDTQPDLGLPFLVLIFLLAMAICPPPMVMQGKLGEHVELWHSSQISPSFKQKKWLHSWCPQPLCRRMKKSAGAWWPGGWKSSQNSCRQRRTISATWISASRKWFSPWETSRWVPGAEEGVVMPRCQLSHVLLVLLADSLHARGVSAQEWRGAGSGSGASAPELDVPGLWGGGWEVRYTPDRLCCTWVKPASRDLSRGQLGYYIPAYGLL